MVLVAPVLHVYDAAPEVAVKVTKLPLQITSLLAAIDAVGIGDTTNVAFAVCLQPFAFSTSTQIFWVPVPVGVKVIL